MRSAPRDAAATAGVLERLERLGRERRTGVLRFGDEGALHLADGAVVHARGRAATGLDRLVLASGTVTAREWSRVRLAMAADAPSGGPGDGGPGADPGDAPAVPVAPWRRSDWPAGLHRARLEVLALLSVFDASYFMLGARGEVRFDPGPPHWMAPVCGVAPGALVREHLRRRAADAAGEDRWPIELADRAPVVPVRRVRRRRVVLTGAQAELLLNADGHRTPADLADLLGRTSYGCLLDARALVGAGLTEPPGRRPDGSAAVPAPRMPPDASPRGEPSRAAASRRPDVPPDAPHGLSVRVSSGPSGEAFWTPPDPTVLSRLRTALKDLD